MVLVAERDAAILGYAYAGIEPLSWKELRDEAGPNEPARRLFGRRGFRPTMIEMTLELD